MESIDTLISTVPGSLSLKHDMDILRVPLLVWIDDNPSNVKDLMAFAEKNGVKVVSLLSTEAAIEWIENHASKLSLLL